MTQKTTLPLTFTGPAAATLPRFVPDAAVTAGLVRRYKASTLDRSQVGSRVPALDAVSGAGPALVQSVDAAQPVLSQEGAIRYLKFDGVDDTMTAAGNIAGQVTTMAILARYRKEIAPNTNWSVCTLGPQLGNGVFSLTYGGTMTAYGNKALGTGVKPGLDWHVFLVTFNGDNSVARVDNTEVTGTLGDPFVSSRVLLGAGTSVTSFGEIDIAEVLVWDRALTAGERARTVTDLRTGYGL